MEEKKGFRCWTVRLTDRSPGPEGGLDLGTKEGGGKGGVINEVEQGSLLSPTTLCFIPRYKNGGAVKSVGGADQINLSHILWKLDFVILAHVWIFYNEEKYLSEGLPL